MSADKKITPRKKTPAGFTYYVSDSQLEAFGRLTPLQRLQWLERARRSMLSNQPRQADPPQKKFTRPKIVKGRF